MSDCGVDSIAICESFDASLSPARSTLGVLVEEMFAPGQLPIVEHNTEFEMTTSFAESSSDIFYLHPLMVPSPQDTEVRARGRTDQPVGVVFFAGASCQFAMLLQIEVPTSSIGMGSREVECL